MTTLFRNTTNPSRSYLIPSVNSTPYNCTAEMRKGNKSIENIDTERTNVGKITCSCIVSICVAHDYKNFFLYK